MTSMQHAPSQGLVRPTLMVEWASPSGRTAMEAWLMERGLMFSVDVRERTPSWAANVNLDWAGIWSRQAIQEAEERIIWSRAIGSREWPCSICTKTDIHTHTESDAIERGLVGR